VCTVATCIAVAMLRCAALPPLTDLAAASAGFGWEGAASDPFVTSMGAALSSLMTADCVRWVLMMLMV
jgi:hypothetical protein